MKKETAKDVFSKALVPAAVFVVVISILQLAFPIVRPVANALFLFTAILLFIIVLQDREVNVKRCVLFCRESIKQIQMGLATFLFAFTIGFVFPVFFAEEIKLFVEQMLDSLAGLSAVGLIGFIFFNNLKASFFAMITGVGFAIFPVVTAVLNGYLLGFISRAAVDSEGILVLWRLLPHGIFELPAILLSIGIGIKIGLDLFKKNPERTLKENLTEALRCFILIILPLLILAAIIEGILISIVK